MNFLLCLIAVGGVAALVLLRLWLYFRKEECPVSVRVLVVAGSGGHTTEILRLLGSLSKDYNPRHYVLADTDKMSAVKIRLFEEKRAERDSESLLKGLRDLEIMSVLPKVIQFLHNDRIWV